MAEYPKLEKFEAEPVSDYLPGEESPEPVTSNSLQTAKMFEQKVNKLQAERDAAESTAKTLNNLRIADRREIEMYQRDLATIKAERDVIREVVKAYAKNYPILEAENTRLRAALEEVEYVPCATEGMDGFRICPWCMEFSDSPHADDCARQSALSPEKKEGE